MISAAFIVKFLKFNFPLIIILTIAAAARIYLIPKLFPFDHDQEVVAQLAYDFFVNHKATLIGQELSFEGFFLGPLHNWIQFIPYGLCDLLPDCVPYFYLIISLITLIFLYKVTKEILDKKTALIAAAIFALSFSQMTNDIVVSSNYFLYLSSAILLYCLYRYFQGENRFLLFGAFSAGLAVVNFNPIYVFSAIAFFFSSLLRSSRKLKIYIFSIIFFFINYIPLIIFNYRHQNILFNNFLKFIDDKTGDLNYLYQLSFIVKNITLPVIAHYFFNNAHVAMIMFTVFLLGLGFYKIVKLKNNFLFYLPITILITVVGFTFYKGHIPDYYFGQTILAATLILIISVKKHAPIFFVCISFFLAFNIFKILNYESSINYKIKKKVITYVISDTAGLPFNAYFDMPPGINTGYAYLFKAFGHQPQEGPKELYLLVQINPDDFSIEHYHRVFPTKKIAVKVIGFIHIVSVK